MAAYDYKTTYDSAQTLLINSLSFRDVCNLMSFLHSQGPPGPPGPSFDVVNILFGYQKTSSFA